MKDSGIEWIGEIPKEWKIGKTLYALSMPITDGPHETPELYDEGIPFVSAEAVSCGNGHIDFDHIRGYISQEFYDECCKKYIPEINDVYMIKSGATTGKVAKVETDEKFTIWSPLAVFRVDDLKYFYEYLYFFIQSDGYQKQIENKWTYGTQQNIGMRTLEKLFLCFPPLEEQKRIAYFLDGKCAKIDAIIEKQQEIIEKLKEYRLSVITEAVTKGLNPDVEMKDSEVEWIGKIPAHWSLVKAKYYVDITNGSDPKEEGDIPVYGSGEKSFKTCGESKEGPCVLLGRKGATLHIPHYIEGLYWNVDTAFDVKPKDGIVLKYYYYLANCFDYKQYISQTTLPGMTQTNYNNMIIPVPYIQEQNDIVNWLDNKIGQINSLIEKITDLTEKKISYKKSLIYEVVTGKREV